jgi:energy-coupling factor transporter transmembrane protein EcfT
MMLSIALRFVPILLQDYHRIKEAQKARGAQFRRGSPFSRGKAFVALLTPFVMNALRKADEMALAMEARGYERGPRTYMHELRFRRSDLLAGLIVLMIAGIIVSKGWILM